MNMTVNSIQSSQNAVHTALSSEGIDSQNASATNKNLSFEAVLAQGSQALEAQVEEKAVEPVMQSLLVANESISKADKPTIKEFMDQTGASFEDASDLLYGVVGSNTELRNWQAILQSDNPVDMLRQATGEMYGFGKPIQNDAPKVLGDGVNTVAASGNFELRQTLDIETEEVINQSLFIIDQFGNGLRSAGNTAEEISRNSWLFGLDISHLESMVEPMASADSALSEQVLKAIELGNNKAEVAVELTDNGRKELETELESLKEQLASLGSTSVQNYQSYTSKIQALELSLAG